MQSLSDQKNARRTLKETIESHLELEVDKNKIQLLAHGRHFSMSKLLKKNKFDDFIKITD